MGTVFFRLVIFVLLVGSYFSMGIPSAIAFVMEVNWTDDAVDINPGDGVCDIDPSPLVTHCSLRAAVQEANAFSGRDTILLHPAVYQLTITGRSEDAAATGDLDITDDLIIQSEGIAQNTTTIVDAEDNDRVFEILDPAPPFNNIEVYFNDFTIEDGFVVGGDGGGGGIKAKYVELYLTGMVIKENEVAGSDGSSDVGGGLRIHAGGSTTEIRKSSISGNSAYNGAGIYNASGVSTMEIYDSTISGNYAVGNVGGILNTGVLRATNVTISGNTAVNTTGGVRSSYVIDSDPTTLDTPLFRNCTIYNNSVPGLSVVTDATITLLNTIVANNGNGNCWANGSIVDESNNLSRDSSCPFNDPDDLNSTDPELGPLADNGGYTLTHLPAASSPVINEGFNLLVSDLLEDQRGITRPQDGIYDIGAVEVETSCMFFPIIRNGGVGSVICL